MLRFYLALFCFLFHSITGNAQFLDDFNSGRLNTDPSALNGWAYFSGDGVAEMNFSPNQHSATISIDARNDTYGIWWALIKRAVSDYIDLQKLSEHGYELRIEARVKTGTAPRRINLHANTNRTTDFHSHLMEYDLLDTNWHRISMTTHDFDAKPGDTVYAQLALMDWGLGQYQLEIDYYKVEVVEAAKARPDIGSPIPYHPPVPTPSEFPYHFPPDFDASVSISEPNKPVHHFATTLDYGLLPVLLVDENHHAILRWDATQFAGHSAVGPGLLQIKTNAVQTREQELEELGQLRVVEILDGHFETEESAFNYTDFLGGLSPDEAINGQMIIDYPVSPGYRSSTFLVINQAVMQRLISGSSKGILLKTLGEMTATFFDRSAGNEFSAVLHFNLKKDSAHAEME